MKRKVVTYFLLSVFLFSTIGVPVTIHFCQMMSSVSFQNCQMCEKEETTMCCNDKQSGESLASSQNDDCCTTKIIADPLTEKFISAFSEIQKLNAKSIVCLLPSEALIDINATNTNFPSDNSPPETFSNSLYLYNSILLI
jgi:hypothetical protein